jgi:hypothetical protein
VQRPQEKINHALVLGGCGLFLPADDRRHYVAWSDLKKEYFDADYWARLWGCNANIDASLTTGIVSADITSGNVILGSNSSDSVNVFGGSATLGTGAGREGFLLGMVASPLAPRPIRLRYRPVPAGASSMIAPAASTVCSTMAASSPHKAQAPIFTPRSATRS